MSTMTINQFDTRSFRDVRVVPVQRETAPVRLTRRGKSVVLASAIAAIAVLAVMFGPSSTATDQAGTPSETSAVRIMPGTTLWDIAVKANPNGDIRKTVDEIIKLNSMPNASALQVGSEIAVPVYSK
ncbi:LysM peptidoglycan-binding domain-containing protein [Aeromicrobium sp. P5_D10]